MLAVPITCMCRAQVHAICPDLAGSSADVYWGTVCEHNSRSACSRHARSRGSETRNCIVCTDNIQSVHVTTPHLVHEDDDDDDGGDVDGDGDEAGLHEDAACWDVGGDHVAPPHACDYGCLHVQHHLAAIYHSLRHRPLVVAAAQRLS